MKGFRFTATVAGLALATLPALAQSTPAQQSGPEQPAATASAIPADQQATKEQVEKLFEVMHLHRQMEAMMGMMPQMIAQAFNAQIKNINAKLPPGKRLMPRDQAALEKVMDKYMQQAQTMYPIDEMIADAVPVYQRHMSKPDADAVITFYNSPAGQHLLSEQPAIMREYMPIVMSRVQERSRRLTDEMEAEMQQIVKPDIDPGKSADCSPQSACGR